MMHKEFGFQQVEKFLQEIAPFGHPDAPAKLIGKGINVMISPLPRNKRAKHPGEGGRPISTSSVPAQSSASTLTPPNSAHPEPVRVATDASEKPSTFGHNPFIDLDIKVG
jgi:hypothetical protein